MLQEEDNILEIAKLQKSRYKNDKHEPTIAIQVPDNDGTPRCYICCWILNKSSKKKPDVTWCHTRSEYNLGDLTHNRGGLDSLLNNNSFLCFAWKTGELLNPHSFLQLSHWSGGHLFGVGPIMTSKMGSLTKCLWTEITLVGLLSGVCSLVPHKGWSVTEGLFANLALERLLSGVSPLMYHKVWSLPEGFLTHLALVWLLSSVCSLVQFKIAFWLNELPQTLHTHDFSPVCVTSCLSRIDLWLNDLPQTSHTYGFSPVCIPSCRKRFERFLKIFPQIPHWCFRSSPESALCFLFFSWTSKFEEVAMLRASSFFTKWLVCSEKQKKPTSHCYHRNAY